MRAYLSLGTNLGDRVDALIQAIEGLAAVGRVERVSALFETVPVGPPQPLYLNAVVALATTVAPGSLLDACAALEARAGRRRTIRWGPRPLDVDILWYDALRWRDGRLTLPHPRALERRFVLEPWVDVWPDGVVFGRPLRWWLQRAAPGGVVRCAGDGWWHRAGRFDGAAGVPRPPVVPESRA